MIYYVKPMHKQRAFSDLKFDKRDFEVTNTLCNTVVSLPMHPYLDEIDINRVITAIISFVERN